MPNSKKIALIGAFSSSILSRNFYFIKQILPHLIKEYSIDIFSLDVSENEGLHCSEVNHNAISGSDRIHLHHLHKFPLLLEDKEYSALIYCLENNNKSYIYRWFAAHYPGIIILQDTSLFKLETGALLHGTDASEINSLVENRYGENAIQIGYQHILGRSLDIYGDFYPFIRDISLKSVAFVHFNPLPFHEGHLFCPTYLSHRPINFGIQNGENITLTQKNLRNTKNSIKKFFVHIESPSSNSSLELLGSIFKDEIKFPLLVSVNFDIDLNTIVDTKIVEEGGLERTDLHEYEAFILLGVRSYTGMPAVLSYAFEDNRTVSAERIGEFKYLPEDSFIRHVKGDSFIDIVSRIVAYSARDKSQRFSESSYSSFSPKNVTSFLSSIISQCEIESSKALEKKSRARERVIQSIVEMEDSKWNYAFDLWSDTFSNQYLEEKKSAIRSLSD